MRLKERDGLPSAPCCVTAEFSVKLTRPTPAEAPLRVLARVVSEEADRAVVEGEVLSGGKVCARGRGTFVAVKPGHPAYHRW